MNIHKRKHVLLISFHRFQFCVARYLPSIVTSLIVPPCPSTQRSASTSPFQGTQSLCGILSSRTSENLAPWGPIPVFIGLARRGGLAIRQFLREKYSLSNKHILRVLNFPKQNFKSFHNLTVHNLHWWPLEISPHGDPKLLRVSGLHPVYPVIQIAWSSILVKSITSNNQSSPQPIASYLVNNSAAKRARHPRHEPTSNK